MIDTNISSLAALHALQITCESLLAYRRENFCGGLYVAILNYCEYRRNWQVCKITIVSKGVPIIQNYQFQAYPVFMLCFLCLYSGLETESFPVG